MAQSTNSQVLPDLIIQFDDINVPTSFPEQKGKVKLIVTNTGAKDFKGLLNLNLYASTDSALNRDAQGQLINDELLGTFERNNVNLKAGGSQSFNLNFATPKFRTASVVAPGAYYLFAEVDPNNTIAESNETNNLSKPQFISEDGTDVVLDWNATLLNAIQSSQPGGTPPPLAARNQAIVHAAIYDAVNAIDRSHKPYFVNIEVSDSRILGASPEAAAVEAAYQTLVYLFPTQKTTFDEQRIRSLAEIPDGEYENKGITLGKFVADQIIALRSNDGSQQAQTPYTLEPTPGVWRPTLPNNTSALLPEWGEVTPFAIPLGSAFRPDGFPALTSAEYAAELNEVKRLGEKNSTVRTPYQTETAVFWAYDRPDTFRPPAQWNEIAADVALQKDNTLAENARLFALLNIAEADAGIAAWDAKYTYNQWRPITAIREADTDGNAATVADSNWEPLLDTPPFPDYISGHSTFGAAAGQILARFFGDNTTFSVTSQELAGVSRTYNSFTEAADENGISRIFGGVHVSSANLEGLATGRTVANYVFDNFLT
jgi:PAP2 superfamily/CARDB